MANTFFGPTALGIDIGDDHLKLALLSQGLTRKVKLLGLLAQPMDPGVVVKGVIENPTAIQQTIITGLKRFKLNVREVVAAVSVPQEKVFLTSLPAEPGVRTTSLEVLAEEHFPLLSKEAEVRSTTLTNGDQHWTVLAALDKSSITRLVRTCDAVGLQIGAVEFDALALARLLRFENTWPEFLLILDIGATHTTFTALHNQSGLFSEYNVKSISGELLTAAISKALALPTSQAEALKRMYGVNFPTKQATPVTDEISKLALVLSKELQTIFSFLTTHRDSPVPLDIPIILVGGGAQTIGLGELLTIIFNRQVLTWTPGNRFKSIPKMPTVAYAAFAVSIGTAIRILQYE